jgi:hypothetical protein
MYIGKMAKSDIGVFGGHTDFGNNQSPSGTSAALEGDGLISRVLSGRLNDIGYHGPLSIEWEDSGMDREAGAKESCAFTKRVDFEPSNVSLLMMPCNNKCKAITNSQNGCKSLKIKKVTR